VSSAETVHHALTLAGAAAAIARGTLTARALAEAQLARVAATDAAILAWTTLDAAHVRAAADRCDATRADVPLRGIGIGVKDIIHTRALPTGLGSPAFAGRRSEADAACVERLAQAGGYVFGKTVSTELAFMHPGPTRNPWNPAHTPGGSSSGSAAAVAAGHVTGAIGTQTNGSVIRPAAYCGVVGFKPSLGAIPFAGVNLFSETFDTLGTFTRNVGDAARLAAALADGIPALPPKRARPPRLALLPQFPWAPVDAATAAALARAAAALRAGGADVAAVALPATWASAAAVHRVIMLAEGARNLAALRRDHDADLSARLRAALDEGGAIAAPDYRAALAERARMLAAVPPWLAGVDAVLTPAAPAAAPAGLEGTGDPACCTLWSLLGVPAITLPNGLDDAGLPLGLQLAAGPGDDAGLLGVAAWCEACLPSVPALRSPQ